MRFIADIHIHSHFSRATSKQLAPEYLDLWALLKGISVIGTGDFTHPDWLKELQEKLDTFAALIKGEQTKGKKTESKKSTPRGTVRESMPSKTTKKGKRTQESVPTGPKPKSMFGKLAERETRSTKSNRAAEVKAEKNVKYPNR